MATEIKWLSIIEKTKGLLCKERGFSKTIWNNIVFIITVGYVIF